VGILTKTAPGVVTKHAGEPSVEEQSFDRLLEIGREIAANKTPPRSPEEVAVAMNAAGVHGDAFAKLVERCGERTTMRERYRQQLVDKAECEELQQQIKALERDTTLKIDEYAAKKRYLNAKLEEVRERKLQTTTARGDLLNTIPNPFFRERLRRLGHRLGQTRQEISQLHKQISECDGRAAAETIRSLKGRAAGLERVLDEMLAEERTFERQLVES
jgi:hypothetical protein